MFKKVAILLCLLLVPVSAQAFTLQECQQACTQYFPVTPPVVDPPPVVPPVVVPPVGAKVFPHQITFENQTDQGNGSAGILFRTLSVGSVTAVTVNGEVARLGVPYKGAPVFLLSLPGENYTRPLQFAIKMSDGVTYVATGGSAGTPSTPTTPTTGYSKSKSFTSYGERNGGRKAWRIPGKGPSYGSQIKFVFASGKEYTIKDTSKNCRGNDPNRCNISSSSNKDGFVYKSGIGPNGEGDSNTGTSHGGIYLHAPYGDKSNTVTLHYN